MPVDVDELIGTSMEDDFLPGSRWIDPEDEEEDRSGGIMGATPIVSTNAASPRALDRLKEKIAQRPKMEKPSVGRRIGAALLGAAGGYLQTQGVRADVSDGVEGILYPGYRRKTKEWSDEVDDLNKAAGIEASQEKAAREGKYYDYRTAAEQARLESEKAQRAHSEAQTKKLNTPKYRPGKDGRWYDSETGLPRESEEEKLQREVAARRKVLTGPGSKLRVGYNEYDMPGAPPDEKDPATREFLYTGKWGDAPKPEKPAAPVVRQAGSAIYERQADGTWKKVASEPRSSDATDKMIAWQREREAQNDKDRILSGSEARYANVRKEAWQRELDIRKRYAPLYKGAKQADAVALQQKEQAEVDAVYNVWLPGQKNAIEADKEARLGVKPPNPVRYPVTPPPGPLPLPLEAAKQLKPGVVTAFANGEKWTLGPDGKPKKIP